MPKGGPQPGSGRPKGKKNRSTIEAEEFRAFIRQEIEKEKGDIIKSQIDAAKGFWALDKKEDTGDRIYEVPPNPAAFKNLMEHGFGKPRQDVDVTTGGESLRSNFIGFEFIQPEKEEEYEQDDVSEDQEQTGDRAEGTV